MKPVLYIVVRNDLASLTCGKIAAQVCHAGNAFVHKVQKLKPIHPARKLYEKWAKETSQGFGTVIVLAGTIEAFREAIKFVENDGGVSFRDSDPVAFAVVRDPTYPIRDGEVTHLIPLYTCAYFFCDREGEGDNHFLMANFPLHP